LNGPSGASTFAELNVELEATETVGGLSN